MRNIITIQHTQSEQHINKMIGSLGNWNLTVPVFTTALREFDLGEANGKSKEWARNNQQCPVWQGTIDWAKSVYDKPFVGAESKADVWDRLSKFLNDVLAETDEDIIIASHDGALSILYALWLGMDIEMLNKCNLSGKTGGVSVLQEDDDGNRIIARLNDMSHIKRC